jgi:hypothetical protein
VAQLVAFGLPQWSQDVAAWAQMSLVDVLAATGPHYRERGFAAFTVDTDPDALRKWVWRHYAAAGIDDPESLHEIRNASACAWRRESVTSLVSQLDSPVGLAAQRSAMTEAYVRLLARGTILPPLVAKRRGRLREGYHRLAAHVAMGATDVSVIRFS